MKKKVLYHGSEKQGIKEFLPQDAGYNEKLVYATSEFPISLIFTNNKRSSLLAEWGMDKKEGSVPYFIERKKGVFNEWYSNHFASIYVFSKKGFEKKEILGSDDHVRVSKNKVKPIKEIKIKDVKKELLKLRKKGKIKITFYRKSLNAGKEKNILEMASIMTKKFGLKSISQLMRKLHPNLHKKFKKVSKKDI